MDGVVVDFSLHRPFFVDAPPSDLTTLAEWRDMLAETPAGDDESHIIDRISELERLKSACAAAQARETARLRQLRREREATAGIPKAQRGKGLAAEVALARRDAPARGSRHLGLATALVDEMPHTLEALTDGRIAEEHATALCKETAWLSAKQRSEVDRRMAHRLGRAGVRRLASEARGHAQKLDHEEAVRHLERTRRQRRVTVRPAPGNMAYLTALLPVQQAVGILASLRSAADAAVHRSETEDSADPAGGPRTRDQIMADLLVERATGQASADAVPAEVHLVMSDGALLGEDDTPAWLSGHGPIPAAAARQWIGDQQAEVFLKRLFTRPGTDTLVSLDSRRRAFPAGLRRMVMLRDDVCRAPYCDALIRDIDHVTPHRRGGKTRWDNASGLCAACNQTKEGRGWIHATHEETLTVTTPTGHEHQVSSPPLLAGTDPPHPPPRIRARGDRLSFGEWLERRRGAS
ncbi:MAG: DUF222 domain-containing protein [Micrococcaceae bacterium]